MFILSTSPGVHSKEGSVRLTSPLGGHLQTILLEITVTLWPSPSPLHNMVPSYELHPLAVLANRHVYACTVLSDSITSLTPSSTPKYRNNAIFLETFLQKMSDFGCGLKCQIYMGLAHETKRDPWQWHHTLVMNVCPLWDESNVSCIQLAHHLNPFLVLLSPPPPSKEYELILMLL